MKQYTTLFLDIDNTILDFNMAEKTAIKRILSDYSLPCDDFVVKLYSDINRSYWEKFERGEIKKEEIYESRFQTLLSNFGLERDVKSMSLNYCKCLSECYFTVDGALEILNYLKDKGYFLCATTNGLASTQHKRIKNSGIEKYFDKIFVSEEAKHQKPEKEYFDYVIKNIPEKDKSNILIIGDSQSSDILGGVNSKIDSCWFNPNGAIKKYESKYEISSLFELKEIL